jgi:hypothetical protein
MKKKYLAKIIAKDNDGLQMISAFCAEAKVNISEIKYLPKTKIFLLSLKRLNKENDKEEMELNSICKFEYVDHVRSKNINQNNKELVLELLTIDLLKNNNNYEISLIFLNNRYITLSTEIIEVTLDDQSQSL